MDIQGQLDELTAGLRGIDGLRITDLHLDEITNSHLEKWRLLPSHLELAQIVVSDIEREHRDERGRRRRLLQLWRERTGNRATYRRLIGALLRIGCREDAEYICGLLRDQPQPPTGEASGLSSSEGL